MIYVEAEADWTKPYEMPDSFTIVQWAEENYRTVSMKRKIAWTDRYFVEVFLADGIPEGKTADWMMHVSGTPIAGEQDDAVACENHFTGKPLTYLHDIKADPVKTEGTYEKTYESDGVFTRIYGLSNGQTVMTATGPDNPSSGEISYLMERRQDGKILCAHVVESWIEESWVKNVKFQVSESEIMVVVMDCEGQEKRFVFCRE